jgi:hypothetical protein
MNEEYQNGNAAEQNPAGDESYYAKYTEDAQTAPQGDAPYKTVMDGVPRSRGWSVASMVLGILSILCCCFTYVPLVMSVLAIIFSIVSRRNLGYFDGMAIAGLVMGIIGFIFSVMALVGDLYVQANPEILEELLKQLQIGGEPVDPGSGF